MIKTDISIWFLTIRLTINLDEIIQLLLCTFESFYHLEEIVFNYEKFFKKIIYLFLYVLIIE